MEPDFPELELLDYPDIDRRHIEAMRALGEKLGRPLSILEAGCGRGWTLDMTGIEYTLTGVDLDPEALESRKNKIRDLDVAIPGDLCTVDLPEASFDVVYSKFVLEHVERADLVLQRIVRWLRPGGLMIVVFPARESARSYYTRLLPFWCHLWFYRYVLGVKLAGRQGHPPYPTHFHPILGGKRFCRFLIENGMNCTGRFAGSYLRKWSLGAFVQRAAVRPISIVTLGKLTADYFNISYVAVKDAQDQR